MLRQRGRFDVTLTGKDSTNVATNEEYFAMNVRTKLRIGLALIIAAVLAHACWFDRATWYGESWRGRKMANGRPYNPDVLTCATWNYPLGTKLRITREKHSVTVEVTDRGGKNRWYQFGKTIDLTPTAFSKLAPLKTGSIEVRIRRAD
jgi:rare lipoprotein A (peptidoglycan hydrolase)